MSKAKTTEKDLSNIHFLSNTGLMIHRISHMSEQLNNKALLKYGVTVQQARIIVFLWFNKDQYINQKAIELEIGVKNASVTSILRNLERLGLITRKNDPRDARNKLVELTVKGMEYHGVFLELMRSSEKRFNKNLSDEEARTLHDILKKALMGIEDYYYTSETGIEAE
jgi:DNA-binding MarR family transcriptional regulator